MEMPKKRKRLLRRVDVQVSLLAAFVVVLASVCIFLFSYLITYNDMLTSLSERVESIYSYLDEEINPASFVVLNNREDTARDCYVEMQAMFNDTKKATGVQYLYTAKRADDGQLIYVVDGLDLDAPDFRYPGDLIEPEIVAELDRALLGEQIMPDDIKRTPWGDIFIAYLPIHGEENCIIGVMGIEFAAGHQYNTYRMLRQSIPVVILLTCVISGGFALLLFRRISNPHFQDLANTDSLTGLKNRNAYELDTRNLCALGAAKGAGLLLFDLNGLKKVNDTLGHAAGDTYIKVMAEALREAATGKEVLYRVGGDEFAVLIKDATQTELQAFTDRLEAAFQRNKTDLMPHVSFAYGYALCNSSGAGAFDETYRTADHTMYECKKQHYATI